MLTNVLWFTAVDRVGPARATLFANLQPFVAAVFAVILLSEPLTLSRSLGGAADRGRRSCSRGRRRPAPAPEYDRGLDDASNDFMPLEGWDDVELWVGNAKQAAYFYEHAFGFTPLAYAGPETGVRDRASYVLEQGHIRFVVTSGLARGQRDRALRHAHGDGVKDVALTVPDATEAYRQAVQRGGAASPSRIGSRTSTAASSSRPSRPTARPSHVRQPRRLRGPYLPGTCRCRQRRDRGGVGLRAIDHVVGNVELGRMNHWVEFYERVFGLDRDDPLLATRTSRPSTRR